METEPKKELAEVMPKAVDSLAEFWQAAGSGRAWTSLDLTKKQHKRAYYNASVADVDGVTTVINSEFNLCDLMLEARNGANDRGEIEDWIKIVLIDDKGECVACGSKGILKSIKALIEIEGLPPWRPGQLVKFRQRELDGGKRWFYLDLIDVPDEPKKKGKS